MSRSCRGFGRWLKTLTTCHSEESEVTKNLAIPLFTERDSSLRSE